ncbi:hypothetical protein C8J57DRAFT_1727258 [Mycena rebaudengoi]|nr:hypothetical protein C8J57DRAFT_1727258 [Mycena rebaudengoi]
MQRSFMIIVLQLLFGDFASVRATQQNFTVDDTSPDIVYSAPTFQCNANTTNTTTCPDGLTEALFNESVTLTSGSIKISFTGIGFHMSFYLIGACSITLDSKQIEFLNVSLANILAHAGDGPQPEGSYITDLAKGPHTLVFVPNKTLAKISNSAVSPIAVNELYQSVTTEVLATFSAICAILSDKKSHVGEIVGGVIGGVVPTIGVLFAGLFARRRRHILRRNQRKSAVLRGLSTASAQPDYKVGADADARPDYSTGAAEIPAQSRGFDLLPTLLFASEDDDGDESDLLAPLEDADHVLKRPAINYMAMQSWKELRMPLTSAVRAPPARPRHAPQHAHLHSVRGPPSPAPHRPHPPLAHEHQLSLAAACMQHISGRRWVLLLFSVTHSSSPSPSARPLRRLHAPRRTPPPLPLSPLSPPPPPPPPSRPCPPRPRPLLHGVTSGRAPATAKAAPATSTPPTLLAPQPFCAARRAPAHPAQAPPHAASCPTVQPHALRRFRVPGVFQPHGQCTRSELGGQSGGPAAAPFPSTQLHVLRHLWVLGRFWDTVEQQRMRRFQVPTTPMTSTTPSPQP